MLLMARKNISGQCDLCDVLFWKQRLEAATISDILYLFGQGNFVFIGENPGNFDVCGNHRPLFVTHIRACVSFLFLFPKARLRCTNMLGKISFRAV